MPSIALLALMALLLSFAGFTAFSLAMDRHQEQVLGRALAHSANHWLRAAGVGILLLSLLLCMLGKSHSVAAIVWLGILTFAALGVATTLSYRPQALLPACGAALLLTAALGMACL